VRRILRIAQVAPPLESVPPSGYGGTERIIHELVTTLHGRGHEVTTFATGDSDVPGRLIPIVPRALRGAVADADPGPYLQVAVRAVLDRAHEFDLIHSHLEWTSPALIRASPVPVVSTFHGRLDAPWATDLLPGLPGLVAISRSQAAAQPTVAWAGIVHNGLSLHAAPLSGAPGDGLAFVGRIAPEKGIVSAIDIARRTGRSLRIVAKRPWTLAEREYHDAVYRPALAAAGSLVEDLGELPADDRDAVVASSHALLMPGAWPEPFGLVAIEALACGTPVVGRRVGALPEIVREGVDGWFGDDEAHLAFLIDRVAGLDRAAIRISALERFSAVRMVDEYEAVYARVGAVAPATAEPIPTVIERAVPEDAAPVVPLRRPARPAIRVESVPRG
jgi:glycosyltransferase involved in cell wall biosynthesis